jgi:hypothetical protein
VRNFKEWVEYSWDKAVTTMDDALSNVLARVGDELTRYGAPGGASSIEELGKENKITKGKNS